MMDSVIKPAPNASQKKHHWLVWILLVIVLCAAAVIAYFAQSGQFFKGAATLPLSQGPIFYVVDELSQYHCDLGNAQIGTTNCPFEGLEAAYNHVAANTQIDPVELRLASGTYRVNDIMEFEGRRINLNGSYDSSTFTKQDFSMISVVHGAIKVTNASGQISGISTFNGGRSDGPFIEIDNTSGVNKSFTVSNVYMSNTIFPSLIKYSSNSNSNQALIQGLHIITSKATNGSIIEVNGPADVLIRNNFLSGNTADNGAIIYAEDNVKIVNNAIVNTPGGSETGGIYTRVAVEIKGGADAKLVNNTFADNAFSSSVVRQDSANDYMWINNNLILGSKQMFNVPELSAAAARGNHWDIAPASSGGVAPIYGINQTYNDRCDPKLEDNRNKYNPTGYKLGAGSDCIDKGMESSAILNLSSPDYFGTNRPAGLNADPGFHEYLTQLGLFTVELRPLTIVGVDDPAIDSVLDGLIIPDIFRDPFIFAICGNGILNTTEECDDGNTLDGDGCSATCTVEQTVVEECGNGVKEGTEECDDGNQVDNDLCNNNCQLKLGGICGDGFMDGFVTPTYSEECDDGNTTSGDGCDATCQIETPATEECGNGILEAGEQCDDGNVANGDGCDNQCLYEDPSQETDLCPNLSGDQLTMPAGYYYDSDDNECKELVADYCLNIDGNQDVIPAGYERIGYNCYEAEVEVACGEWVDVSDRDPEFDIWMWLCEKEILKGHSDGSLRPDDSLTRSELLALAFRASDYENEYEVDEDASYCFVDVDDEWFAQYACTAEDLGFVEGYAGNIFDPARKVILAEGLKMFLGALDEPFTINSNPNEWYYDMLFDAEDDDFLPYTLTDPQVVGPIELTRRKAANMLYRIMIYR